MDAVPVVEKLFGPSFAAHDEAGDARMREGTTSTYNFGKNILYLMSPLDLTHTGDKPFEANQHALDSVASSQNLSEELEPQLVENDSKDLDGDVTLQLHIKGRFEISTNILYLEHHFSQTSSFNAQRMDSTFRPSIRSDSQLLDLRPGTREFGF